MSKIFYDLEFSENGMTIDFISIGMVCEDGREYYVVSNEFNEEACNDWVKENVLPFLPDQSQRKSKEQIKNELLEFCGDEPEFWASYGAYDHVCLCQLFGTMIDLPKHWPMFTRDIQQLKQELGDPELPEQKGKEHDALEDARGCKMKYEFLINLKKKANNRFSKLLNENY
jgi:hypothetical protein